MRRSQRATRWQFLIRLALKPQPHGVSYALGYLFGIGLTLAPFALVERKRLFHYDVMRLLLQGFKSDLAA
jgi:hypothetical protein